MLFTIAWLYARDMVCAREQEHANATTACGKCGVACLLCAARANGHTGSKITLEVPPE